MIEKIFGSAPHFKILLYLYGLKQRQKVSIKMIRQNTGLSYPTVEKVLKDFRKAKIILIMGATRSQLIVPYSESRSKKVVWKFIKDFEGSFYR